MAGVRCEKRGRYWQYVFEGAKVDGKRKRITKSGFRTKAAAAEAGAKAMAEYNEAGVRFIPSSMSFSDFLDYWLESYGTINLKDFTLRNYKRRIDYHIKPVLGKYKLSALSSLALQEFIDEKARQNYSKNTIAVFKSILTVSLGFAVQQNLLRYNPMYNVRLPSYRNDSLKPRSAPHVYISPDRIEQIFDYFQEGHIAHIPLMLGYKCGMRLGEVFGLTWDAIDFDARTINISKQAQWNEEKHIWYFTNPKFNSIRIIEVDSSTIELLKRHKAHQDDMKILYEDEYTYYYQDDYGVIQNTGGGSPIGFVNTRENGSYFTSKNMEYYARVIQQKLDFPEFTFHSLRHTHATLLAENDAPIKYVQNRLGHKNAQVTMHIYQHLTQKLSDKGVGILDRLFA